MKLLLLVIGCCVALAVSKPAEDACAAMRARLLPSQESSVRADAGALRACDADSDGAVDAAELVSCVQRAFGSTAHMDRAEITERVNCFRGLMTGTALGKERRLMVDNEEARQMGLSSSIGTGGESDWLPRLDCEDQNQLGQILAAIAIGRLQAAYDSLINWYIFIITQSSGLLNGLLHSVSFILQSVLSGRSFEALVFMVTAFVRSASNALTLPVEDALITALFEISFGNATAAQITIQARLDAGVLNTVTQDELQWIIDEFNNGSSQAAVTGIISLLAGYETALDNSTLYQLLGVFDQLVEESETARLSFFLLLAEIQVTQQCLSDFLLQALGGISMAFQPGDFAGPIRRIITFITFLCGYDSQFGYSLAAVVNDINGNATQQILTDLIESYGNNTAYAQPIAYLEAASTALVSGTAGALAEIRNILEDCISA